MRKMMIDSTKEIKSNSILVDSILSLTNKDNEILKIADNPHILITKNKIKHLAYIPGFSSSFNENADIKKILSDLEALKIDSAIFQFLSKKSVENLIMECEASNIYLTKYDSKQISFINTQESIDLILKKLKYENRRLVGKFFHHDLIKFSFNYDRKFFNLYQKRANEKNYTESYIFSKEDFEKLSTFDEIIFISLYFEENFIGGSFFREIYNKNKIIRLDYLLTAIERDKKILKNMRKPSNLILWKAYNYAIDRNIPLVNLGGGITENDSLFNYKINMGGEESFFYRCRMLNKKSKLYPNLMLRLNSINFPFAN